MIASTSRRSPWMRSFRFALPLLVLGGGVPFAAEVTREIPVARDRGGSECTVEITRDGARQTATPTASITEPTLERIAGQIEERTGIDLRQGDSLAKTFRSAGIPEGEITARDAKAMLRELRDGVRGNGVHAASPAGRN